MPLSTKMFSKENIIAISVKDLVPLYLCFQIPDLNFRNVAFVVEYSLSKTRWYPEPV